MEYLPSKNFGVTAVFILAAFAGWFFVFGPGKGTEPSVVAYKNTTTLAEITPVSVPNIESEKIEADTRESYLGLEERRVPVSQLDVATSETAMTEEELRAYGVLFQKALVPYSTKDRKNEVELMMRALEKGEATKAQAEIAGLKVAVGIHESVREKLLSILVPTEIAPLHAEIITIVSRIGKLVLNMRNVLEDPVLALSSAEQYSTESQNLKAALGVMNDKFSQEGITFKDSEKTNIVLYETE